MLNFIERKKAFVLVALLATSAAGANELVSYHLTAGLPLKHDGYIVERRGTGNGERVKFVVTAETARAFLYANYESNSWMNASSYPFVRDPHFKTRALDVSRSPEPLRDWIAATGANAVYFKRGRPDAKRLRECAALGVDAYSFLYGCDAAKWNRARYRFHTFMEDPVYRWSVATQNNGYNVPAEPRWRLSMREGRNLLRPTREWRRWGMRSQQVATLPHSDFHKCADYAIIRAFTTLRKGKAE